MQEQTVRPESFTVWKLHLQISMTLRSSMIVSTEKNKQYLEIRDTLRRKENKTSENSESSVEYSTRQQDERNSLRNKRNETRSSQVYEPKQNIRSIPSNAYSDIEKSDTDDSRRILYRYLLSSFLQTYTE
jgi:hypothetical protein